MALAVRLLKKINFQLIMAKPLSTTAQKLNDAVEELKSNPYYEKYASKIATLQQTSPEEFLAAVDARTKSKKPSETKVKEQTAFPSGSAKPLVQPKVQYTRKKMLNDVMKMELIANKSAEEIKQIWLDYHKNKDAIAAVIPAETYKILHERGQEFNTFLLPLPRNEGYEFIVSQFYGDEVHFTPLIAYQTHKENAPECLTIVHFPELMEEKGIVLMKGDFNTDLLQAHEAQCLINELQLYYAQNNEKRLKILHRFTYAPDEFKHMDLVAELECLSI